MRTRQMVLVLGLAAVAACGGGMAESTTDEPGGPVAQTSAGALEGLRANQSAGVAVFRGVAFAKPPVGDLRWRPPASVEPWEGTQMATEFGPACWQARNDDNSPYARGELPRSEDCLTLNVWTSARAGERAPVMVWFHGGGHSSGVGSAAIFDGTAMAKKGVLMVTANYRLGPLGFLAHPALTAESHHAASGNYGILDHIATLEWGARQHCRVWRRPRQRDHLRSVGWVVVSLCATGVTTSEGTVPQGDRSLWWMFRRTPKAPGEDGRRRDRVVGS